jgi:hypothetical protein
MSRFGFKLRFLLVLLFELTYQHGSHKITKAPFNNYYDNFFMKYTKNNESSGNKTFINSTQLSAFLKGLYDLNDEGEFHVSKANTEFDDPVSGLKFRFFSCIGCRFVY